MNSIQKHLYLILVLLFLVSPLNLVFAQDDGLMDRAIKNYLGGDYQGAIQGFERILENEDNPEARRLLFKSIVEEGKNNFENENFEKAKEYFLRAEELYPDDEEVKNYLEELEEGEDKEPEEKQESSGSPADSNLEELIVELRNQISRERAAKNRYRNTINTLSTQKNSLEESLNTTKEKLAQTESQLKSMAENLEEDDMALGWIGYGIGGVALIIGVVLIIILRKVYFTSNESIYQLDELEDRILGRLEEAEEESEELEERVSRSINQMVKGQQEAVKQISHSAAGKTQEDIEQIKNELENQFSRQQEKLLELLNMQARALSSEQTEKVELKSGRVITDVNPHVRARADGVEMIPKTVSDPNVAQKMLKPYLSDSNNRVRANACVAIHQYNPELAVETLEKMADSPNKWMRLSAAWALGEIATPKVTHILRKLLDDVDDRVKEKAMEAFENMAEVKQEAGSEIRKMIDRIQKEQEEE
ncbi:MAG: HEAT repeat domain-containing protein [Elusimicrobiota bacterium]